MADEALAAERTALAAARLECDALAAAAHQSAESSEARAIETAAALVYPHQRPEDRRQLVDQQAKQLADLAQQRDRALSRSDESAREAQILRERLEARLRDAELAREAQAAHVRAVEDRAHGEIDRARQEAREREKALLAAEKAHAARSRELEADLAQSRATAAQSAKELAAEHARRETLEQQLAEANRRLDAALKAVARTPRLAAPRKPVAAPRRPRAR
jgi:hypothetical protein